MLHNKPVNKIVFLDIETTSLSPTFAALDKRKQKLFRRRFKTDFENITKVISTDQERENFIEELYNQKAPVYPETGKIICISCGVLKVKNGIPYAIHIENYANEDERVLLMEYMNGQEKVLANTNDYSLCAHNGSNFDFAFIAKRIIIHGLILPDYFNYGSKKPWEVAYLIDTKNLWKFNTYDTPIALDALCDLFGIETSKDDIDGSQVKDIYWIDKDIPRIAIYCDKDVLALARTYLYMNGIFAEIETPEHLKKIM